jgi:hypothetical protein
MAADRIKSVIAIIMVCLSSALSAQKPHIYGTVQDIETYSALPNVNISFTGTKLGCSTNANGEFSISIDTIPVYMIVSHLGYETQRIWLENTSGGINILLKPAARLLHEIEIKSQKEPQPFFKDDHYAILDYEVDNTLVYLLIYRFRLAKSELICKSDEGDTIARSGNLPFRPTGIFSDCLGYLHVLSADSAYQVFLRKDTLIFPHKADIQKFRSTMTDCVASTEDWLIFRKESVDRQTVDFYRINRKTSRKEYFASVKDDEKLKMLMHNPLDYYLLVMDTLPNSNEEIAEWVWVNKILYKPNASVLYKIGDTLSLFNTTNGTLDLYDLDGKLVSRLTIPIIKTGDGEWTKEIYTDQSTHIPYTSFLKNGIFTLYRINLNTGKLKMMQRAAHAFPQKVKVHHNFLYYIYDLPGTSDNKQLFRQKI